MKTPPASLPPIPEGWVYIGADDGSLVIEGCDNEMIDGINEGLHDSWDIEHPKPANFWSLRGKTPTWHFIAKVGSKIAQLNGADEPLVSAEEYALLMKKNEHLTRENERLKQQIESRNQIIVGFRDSINRVMDF